MLKKELTLVRKAANSSWFIGTLWSFQYHSRIGTVWFSASIKRFPFRVERFPFRIERFSFLILPLVSRNGIFKKLAHVVPKCLLPNNILQSQKNSDYISERSFLELLIQSLENYIPAFIAWFIPIVTRSKSPCITLCGLLFSLQFPLMLFTPRLISNFAL
jgi:hypothetical protein